MFNEHSTIVRSYLHPRLHPPLQLQMQQMVELYIRLAEMETGREVSSAFQSTPPYLVTVVWRRTEAQKGAGVWYQGGRAIVQDQVAS